MDEDGVNPQQSLCPDRNKHSGQTSPNRGTNGQDCVEVVASASNPTLQDVALTTDASKAKLHSDDQSGLDSILEDQAERGQHQISNVVQNITAVKPKPSAEAGKVLISPNQLEVAHGQQKISGMLIPLNKESYRPPAALCNVMLRPEMPNQASLICNSIILGPTPRQTQNLMVQNAANASKNKPVYNIYQTARQVPVNSHQRTTENETIKQKGTVTTSSTVQSSANVSAKNNIVFIQREIPAPVVGFKTPSTEPKVHLSVSEIDKKENTSKPLYYRDIRKSATNLICNESTKTQVSYSPTQSMHGQPNISEKECSTSEKTNPVNLEISEDKPAVSTKTESSEDVATSKVENEIDRDDKTRNLKILLQKKTPTKAKRKRKSKLLFSPSGNDISEMDDFDNELHETKKTKRRKGNKEGMGSQYYGALQRTVARKIKQPNSMNESDKCPELLETNSRANGNKTLIHKLGAPNPDSDYKLKQKLIHNMSKSTENVKSHHLLKKIDPNDPDRKRSLAIFASQNRLVDQSRTTTYKLSVNVSPSSIESTSTAQTESLNTIAINEEDIKCKSTKPGKLKSAGKYIRTPEGEKKDIALAMVNVEKPAYNDKLTDSKSNWKEKGKQTFGNSMELQGSFDESTGTGGTKSDTFLCNRPSTNHYAKGTDNLGPIKSPSVVLKRISGVTPNVPIHLNELLKKQNTDSTVQEKQSSVNEQMVPNLHKCEIKSTDKPSRQNSKPHKKIKGQEESIIERSSSSSPTCSVIDQQNQTKNEAQKNSLPEKDVLLQTSLSGSSSLQNDDTSRTNINTSSVYENEVYRTLNCENVKKSQTSLCHSASWQNNACYNGKDKSVYSDPDKSNNKVSTSEQMCCSNERNAQPIPIFISDRIMPSPMPLTSETYNYLLSKGSPVKSLLPTPHTLQSFSEKRNTTGNSCNDKQKYTFKTVKIITNKPNKSGPVVVPSNASGSHEIATKHKTNKTVAELLKEKRKESPPEKSPAVSIASKNEPHTYASYCMPTSVVKETSTDHQVLKTDVKSKINPGSSTDTQKEISLKTFLAPSSSHKTTKEFNNGNFSNEHLLRKSTSLSPLVSMYTENYSTPISPLVQPRRAASETMKLPCEEKGVITKDTLKSPCIPLKIMLPSPKKSGSTSSNSPTIKLPITVQSVTNLPTPSTHDLPLSKKNCGVETDKGFVNDNASITNQSYAVRIGDKMYIIRPATPVNDMAVKNVETKQNSTLEPCTTSPIKQKGAKRGKSKTKKGIDHQPCLAKKHKGDLKSKIKTIVKKDKSPLENLIESLGLTHIKDKRKKLKRKHQHKINYTSTSSPVASTSGSLSYIKQEPATPNLPDSGSMAASFRNNENVQIKLEPSPTQQVLQKATILQIFKLENMGCKFYMQTVKINFTKGPNSSYYRWFQHSDYPCTLHLKNYDTIYQIDVESLRSGFYLVSEMDKDILLTRPDEMFSMKAILSLYPPDISVLPERALAIVVGKISDDFASPVRDESEKNSINENVDNIVRSMLKLDTFTGVENYDDKKYESVKDACMSPKHHSSQFYTPALFEIFTPNRRKGRIITAPAKNSISKGSVSSVSRNNKPPSPCEYVKNINSKAQELKLKQSELYDKCKELQDKIRNSNIHPDMLLAADVAHDFDSLDEFYTDTSQEEESESCTSEAESIPVQSYVSRGGRGRGKNLLHKQLDQEVDTNDNATINVRGRRLRSKRISEYNRGNRQYHTFRSTRSSSLSGS